MFRTMLSLAVYKQEKDDRGVARGSRNFSLKLFPGSSAKEVPFKLLA